MEDVALTPAKETTAAPGQVALRRSCCRRETESSWQKLELEIQHGEDLDASTEMSSLILSHPHPVVCIRLSSQEKRVPKSYK